MFKKCLMTGALFGCLNGIVVAIFAIRLNHLPLKLNNIVLVPFYHGLIYLFVGVLAGVVLFILIWTTTKFFSNLSGYLETNLTIILLTAFVALSGLFVFRLFRGFSHQETKHAIQFNRVEAERLQKEPLRLASNKDVVVQSGPHFKLILFALDAATFTVIDSMISDNRLPNLRRLIENGVRADVQTIKPTRSPIIWTTVATGKLPEEHGVWDFVLSKMPGTSFTRGRFKYPNASGMKRLAGFFADISFIPNIPYTSNLRRVKAFWNILSEYDRRVGVIGWYTSFPAETVNGFLVSDGFFYSTRYEDEEVISSMTYPAELYHDIKDLARDSTSITTEQLLSAFHITEETWQKIEQSKHFDTITYLLRLTYTRDERTIRVARKLLNEYGFGNLDLLAVYFKSLDEVSHAACEENQDELLTIQGGISICWENVLAAYEHADTRIGEILEFADENTAVMLVSDHGFSYGTITGERSVGHWNGQDGLFVLSGPHIRKNQLLKRITVLDILPTLLYMQNLPVALDLKGQVILEAFEDEFVDSHPVMSVSTFEVGSNSSEVPLETKINKEIEKKLKSLGYLN